MAKTSIIISTTESGTGKKLTKTLTDINVNASNEQLKSFAQALNGLTTNVYNETNRVDKLNCDTEAQTAGSAASPELTKVSFTSSLLVLDFKSNATPRAFITSLKEDPTGEDGYCAELTLTQTSADGIRHNYSVYGASSFFSTFKDSDLYCIVVLPATEAFSKDWIIFGVE